MTAPYSDTTTLIEAMRILARDIQCDDGIAYAAIAEAAERLELQQTAIIRMADALQVYACPECCTQRRYKDGTCEMGLDCGLPAREALEAVGVYHG